MATVFRVEDKPSIFDAFEVDKVVRRNLWNLEFPPNLEFFLWKLFHNILPVKVKLAQRGLPVDVLCLLCRVESETMDHLFIDCSVDRAVWFGSELSIKVESLPALSAELVEDYRRTVDLISKLQEVIEPKVKGSMVAQGHCDRGSCVSRTLSNAKATLQCVGWILTQRKSKYYLVATTLFDEQGLVQGQFFL